MQTNTTEMIALHSAASRADIPLGRLRLSATYQARHQPSGESATSASAELKASIQTMGLLQNLVVTQVEDGWYDMCAGGRRLAALIGLVEDGLFADDHPVPCLIVTTGHAHHASLLENLARQDMHPTDVFAGYVRLRADGWSVDAIATAHGVAVSSVRKLLALGDVAPSLLELFRAGKATMDDMQALASVVDHTRQEAAWTAAKGSWNRTVAIRSFLSQSEVRGDTALARYVTVAAYEKAGGNVRRDLFAERGDDAYLEDAGLLETLALAKMERSKMARTLAEEGWAWVDRATSFSYEQRRQFGEIHRVRRDPNPIEAKQIAALDKKIDALADKIRVMEEDEGRDDDVYEKLHADLESLDDEKEGIRDELYDYPDALKAVAGVMMHVDHAGKLVATRGLIKPEDRGAAQALLQEQATSEGGLPSEAAALPPTKTRPVHSAALLERLQAERVMALQAEIMIRPNLALCLLVQQLLVDVSGKIEDDWKFVSSFDVRATSGQHDLERVNADAAQSKAGRAVGEHADSMLANVPADADALLPWLLEQAQADVLDLLSLLTARTVYRRSSTQATPTRHLDRLASVVGLDMAKWWQPTASSYLSHVTKDRIADVVAKAGKADGAERIRSMKKAAAVEKAEQLLAGSGWLPEVFDVAEVPTPKEDEDSPL